MSEYASLWVALAWIFSPQGNQRQPGAQKGSGLNWQTLSYQKYHSTNAYALLIEPRLLSTMRRAMARWLFCTSPSILNPVLVAICGIICVLMNYGGDYGGG